MGNKICSNCLNNNDDKSDVPVEDKINEKKNSNNKVAQNIKVISEEEKLDMSNDNLLKDNSNKQLIQTKTVNFNFGNSNLNKNSNYTHGITENELNQNENNQQIEKENEYVKTAKLSEKAINPNNNHIVLKRSAKNFTFSKETSTFVNNIIQINPNQCQINKKGNSFLNLTNYKVSTSSSDEVILQNEFYFNSKMINNTLNRMKTVEVSRNKKYILLTRTHIKLYKNKNIYISYGSIEEEYKINDIVKCEFMNNPFRKMKLYTINFIHGKNNLEFSISSENQSDIETWFKLIKFLMNSSFL